LPQRRCLSLQTPACCDRASPPTYSYGAVQLGSNAAIEITNGITATNGTLLVFENQGSNLILDGQTKIETGAVVASSPNDGGCVTINGTVSVEPAGRATLNLSEVQVYGSGAVVQTGESDTTKVGVVRGGTFQIYGGTLAIADASPFEGVIGPASGDPTAPTLGIFGEVDVFGNAADTASAIYNTSSHVLSLLNNQGQYLGALQTERRRKWYSFG
jgi:hypothetical protein